MRSYALTELEERSALSRRTIGDYVSKGLLSGPSHRGRGARYPQRDLDALNVIPRLRTVLKAEFPNLGVVRSFLAAISTADLHHLSRIQNERVFEIEVRRLRLLRQLISFLPTVPPEQIKAVLMRLTPEQVCGIDRGNYQVSSLVDLAALADPTIEAQENGHEAPASPDGHYANRNGSAHDNGNGPGHADSDDWERFGTPTVEIRIEKKALDNRDTAGHIQGAIRDFAEKLEHLLKAHG
jgi:DNA-binding transcriptional MerR regulator